MPDNIEIQSISNLVRQNRLESRLNVDLRVIEELDGNIIIGDIESETNHLKREQFVLYQTIKNMINEVLIKMDTATVNPIMLQSLERLFKTASDILNTINNINKAERMALALNKNSSTNKVDAISEDSIIQDMRRKQLEEADRILAIELGENNSN